MDSENSDEEGEAREGQGENRDARDARAGVHRRDVDRAADYGSSLGGACRGLAFEIPITPAALRQHAAAGAGAPAMHMGVDAGREWRRGGGRGVAASRELRQLVGLAAQGGRGSADASSSHSHAGLTWAEAAATQHSRSSDVSSSDDMFLGAGGAGREGPGGFAAAAASKRTALERLKMLRASSGSGALHPQADFTAVSGGVAGARHGYQADGHEHFNMSGHAGMGVGARDAHYGQSSLLGLTRGAQLARDLAQEDVAMRAVAKMANRVYSAQQRGI